MDTSKATNMNKTNETKQYSEAYCTISFNLSVPSAHPRIVFTATDTKDKVAMSFTAVKLNDEVVHFFYKVAIR